MRWQPKNKRVIVSPTVLSNKTESGLYIPESAKEVPVSGEISAACEGSEYKVGETILFGKYAGSIINVDGNDYLILLEEDIFCVLDEKSDD